MQSVVGQGKAVALFDGSAIAFKVQAQGVGAFAEAKHGVAFAADPVRLAGGSVQRAATEQRAAGDLDFNTHGGAKRDGVLTQTDPQVPGVVRGKGVEAQKLLLAGYDVNVLVKAHKILVSPCVILFFRPPRGFARRG